MTITELIAALEALRAEHGDLPVYTTEYGCCDHIEVTGDYEKSVEVNIQ